MLIPSVLKNFDWKLNLAVFILMIASLLSLSSTGSEFFWKQIMWYGVGLLAAYFFFSFDWRAFINYKGVIFGIYIAIILLLLATYFFAPTVRGIRGWLTIGQFQFQVAELAKLSLIILYASFFSRHHVSIARTSNIIKSFLYFLIPGFLIAIQPDFGSALILFALWFGFLLVCGIKWRHLAAAMILFAVVGGVLWSYIFADYQKERIVGLFYPESDPLGVNYSTIQAKIAVGSAGFFGKGFKQGTQSQLGFLTEPQTDFIFSAFAEEWGIFGIIVLIVAFLVMIFSILKIGLLSSGNFGQFICLGTAILFSTQFLLNVGSNIGLTPVIGVTFPFLSYGGSSVLTNFALIGIIQSINFRRSL